MSSHCKMESTTPDQINYAGVDIARDRLDYSLPDSRFGEKFQPRLLASADAAPVTLRELQGVGPVLAATLLAYVPELGQIDSPQLSALIGVAPFARDSGRILRPRHMRGGRAVTAARCNP
ncbi:MAG: transposase, partial [Opitutaceae bacterium]